MIEKQEEEEPRTISSYMDWANRAIQLVLPEILNGNPHWDNFLNDTVFNLLSENLKLRKTQDLRNLDGNEIFGKIVGGLLEVKTRRDNFFRDRKSLRTHPGIEIGPFLIFQTAWTEIKDTRLEEYFETLKNFESRIPEKFNHLFIYSVNSIAGDFFYDGDLNSWIPSKRNLEILFEGIVYAIQGIDEENLAKVYSAIFNDRNFTKEGLYVYSANFKNKLRSKSGKQVFWERFYETGDFYPNLVHGLIALGEKDGLEDLNIETLASIYGLDH